MSSLYQIDQEILECLDMETGEIIDAERLTALQMERNAKIEGVACWVKNLEADALAYKAEMDAFKARKEQAEAKAERLKEWLIEATGGEKMNLPKASISFRNSEKVLILAEDLVPNEFMRKKVTFFPDKTAIKEAIKNGEFINGCDLVSSKNIQIK